MHGKANLKRWVLSFERNAESNNELRVSGGREFQSLGVMTEKALLPRDVSDIWDGQNRCVLSSCRQRVRRKRKTIVKIGRLLNLKRFICKKTVCNRCVVHDCEANVIHSEYSCNVFKF